MSRHVVVRADGGSRGNPGIAGCGAIVVDPETSDLLAWDHKFVGNCETNNVAEYSGLILGLGLAKRMGASSLDVEMDSQLVVNQMTGAWQTKSPTLRILAAQARALSGEFERVTYEWIARELNSQADDLANQAMRREKLRKPPPVAGDVMVRQVDPTVQAPTPYEGSNGQHRTVRVERTAFLAASRGIDGSPDDIARALREQAPDELADIWDRLPGVRWLAEAISGSPVSWHRAHRNAITEHATSGGVS